MSTPPTQLGPSDPGPKPAPPPLLELGPYRILGEIGRGGMGVVHLAEHRELGRRVALKVLPARLQASEHALQRFEREARAVARLGHPRIVPVYEVGCIDGQPYFSMEHIDGATLQQLLAGIRERETVFAELRPRDLWPEGVVPEPGTTGSDTGPRSYLEAACRIVLQVAEGLQHAHEHGVVHRDVKPSNVLVARDGRALLFDFGLAKIAEDASLTVTGEFLGTPHYVSPEQAAPRGRVADGRSDVFSLGATLYELLTLAVPFAGDTPHEVLRLIAVADPRPPRRVNPLVPRDLETICLHALAKDPARRYQSAAELAQDLRRFLEFRPVAARPLSPAARALRTLRRHLVATTLVGLGVLVAAALGVAGWQLRVNRAVAEARDQAQQASARSRFAEGALLAQRGQWDAALAAYADADRQGLPEPLDLAVARIEALEGKGDLRTAQVELQRLRALPELRGRRAKVLLLAADLGVQRRLLPEAGLDLVQQALELGGLEPAEVAYAGALLAHDLPAVLAALEQTLTLHPFHRRAHESIVPVLVSQGLHERALAAARRMRTLYPRDPYPLLLEVVASTLHGDLEGAATTLELAGERLGAAHRVDLDAWARDLARSATLQHDLLALLLGGPRLGQRAEGALLGAELMQSPWQVLPGVPRASDDAGGFVVEFRLPPALARSYLPLAAAASAAPVIGSSGRRLETMELLLAQALAVAPDGYRSFLRGLCRYYLGIQELDPAARAARLRGAEADFLAAVATPSMFAIERAAAFYALEAQRGQLRGLRRDLRDRELRQRAIASVRWLVDHPSAAELEMASTARAALELGELDLAEEVALRLARLHPRSASAQAVRNELAVRRGLGQAWHELRARASRAREAPK